MRKNQNISKNRERFITNITKNFNIYRNNFLQKNYLSLNLKENIFNETNSEIIINRRQDILFEGIFSINTVLHQKDQNMFLKVYAESLI